MSKRPTNRSLATSLRVRSIPKRNDSNLADRRLERAKSLATIFSAVAIPIVLTVAGYYIQRQLSNEGIRKDYVGIATAILKEKAETQEPELRAWAVKILDENAPIPFTKKAKESLLTGIVVNGLPWMGPPDNCRIPPPKRTILQQFKKLASSSHSVGDNEYIKLLANFAESVVKQEEEALLVSIRLKCMQEWASSAEKSDIDYRNAIGAPSSKSIYEELRKNGAATIPEDKPPKSDIPNLGR
jgi:hypothetical protein